MMRYGWQTTPPPANRVVEVWYETSIILAVWTGERWTTIEGVALRNVTHWRPR